MAVARPVWGLPSTPPRAGYDVCLLEAYDFAQGTSSRSTKLVHGGVRYLQQGNLSLVRDALRERERLARNAPHLVRSLTFVLPTYRLFASHYYGLGLKAYDWLAGRQSFGQSRRLSRDEVLERLPMLTPEHLNGGALYYDGLFDDARLAINLAQTAAEHGAAVLNYAPVTQLRKNASGRVIGLEATDAETNETLVVDARVVINATGPFCDSIRRLNDASCQPMIAPSQGIHIVLDPSFLPGSHALLVPKTDDGRVLFAIPWEGVVSVGTTDTPIREVSHDPRPQPGEIAFVLETLNRYLTRVVTTSDIRSVFVGIRPLVRMPDVSNTASLSRDHTIVIDQRSQLLTIAGGKWTTYRKMAQDAVDRAAAVGGLTAAPCRTTDLSIHGATSTLEEGQLSVYGSDAEKIRDLAATDARFADLVHPELPVTRGQVVWACRAEMARTIEDVLSRRTRWLIKHASAAARAAESVAVVMSEELGRDAKWRNAQVGEFRSLANRMGQTL